MPDTDVTVQKNWQVVEDDYQRFRANVAEKWGTVNGYVGIEFDRAAREFFDEDEFAELEEYVRTESSSPSTGDDEKEKPSDSVPTRSRTDAEDRTTFTKRFHKSTADQIVRFARENDLRIWQVVTAIMREANAGGRAQRLKDELMNATTDEPLSGANSESNDTSEQTYEDKKVEWLANEFTDDDGTPKQFKRDDFGEALEEMPYRGGDTDHMRNRWLPKVCDRLDLTEHPFDPDLFVTEENAASALRGQGFDPDAPACEYRDYEDLSDEQRVHAIRVELVRAADSRGTSGATTEKVRRRIFDGEPTPRKARRLMEKATDASGFETDQKYGEKRIKCDLADVTNEDVLADADLHDRDADDVDETDVVDDVQEEMNELIRAETEATSDGDHG